MAFIYITEIVFRILFWNVENFFDPFENQGGRDIEFTSRGERFWNWKRFEKKCFDISKGVIFAGEGDLPVLVGFAEVENRFVLNALLSKTPLSMADYRIIHKDSPDVRGIDVALLYRKNIFKPIEINFIEVILDDSVKTRDILHVKGVLDIVDTLHIIVNHWPSKISGNAYSERRRRAVSAKVQMMLDSINIDQDSKVILMGDFNDTPENDYLNFKVMSNLGIDLYKKGVGSIKYKGVWELIDQFIVSKSLISDSSLYVDKKGMDVILFGYLLEKDKEFLGYKPRRTYIGPIYNGGVSDHLPILIKLKKRVQF